MAETVNRYGTYKVDRTKFGGTIEIEDFSTFSPNKKRIDNQIDAINLQSNIKQELIKRKEEQKYKNMTLEKLREMKIVSNSNGRPSSTLTDKKWQKEFDIRKLFITPFPKGVSKLGGKYSKESGMWNEETMGQYDGMTNWQEYCAYINSVLDSIRKGQVDYCYFIYQILDLLKFHYNTLKTKYCDGYWEVWLER